MPAVRSSPFAFPAEVARYLSVEPRDVEPLIKRDGLPGTQVPGKTKMVWRINLRAFHQWVLARTQNPGPLVNYDAFLADFEPCRTVRRKGGGESAE